MINQGEGLTTGLDLSHAESQFNAQALLFQNMMTRVHTAIMVRVLAVSASGPVDTPGTVDIQPLVNMVDALGNSSAHGVIFACPYFRLQGGANAVIIDPEIGDIGIAVIGERDLSAVIASKNASNPGSRRRFDLSDALYLGGYLNAAPTQYVRFHAVGIDVVSTGAVKVQAATAIELDAPALTVNAESTFNGMVNMPQGFAAQGTATSNGKNISDSHTHHSGSGSPGTVT